MQPESTFSCPRVTNQLKILAFLAAGATAGVLGPPGLGGQEAPRSVEPKPRNAVVPMPILFRQPETGTGFGAAATYFFRVDPTQTGRLSAPVSPSTVTAVVIYTTKDQIITAVEPVLRLRDDRTRIAGALEYLRFPTSFWGIGNDTGDDLEESFSAQAVNLEAQALQRIGSSWYGGVAARFARRQLSDLEEGGLLDRGEVPGTETGQIVGLGFALTRDTRDRSVGTRSGAFHQLLLGRFDSFLGSDFEYTELYLDLRRYAPVGPGRVLAVRALGQSITGTAPFDVLPQLGGEELLRGYYGGRFRDKNLLALQAELRAHIGWRFGAAAFGSLGQVSPSMSAFRLEGVKVAMGGGLRFVINQAEGLNLRADFGWGLGEGTKAFYLALGEVF